MDTKLIFELPMFSDLLDGNPQFQFQGEDLTIDIKGWDCDDNYSKVTLKFSSVVIFRETHPYFKYILGAYESIVELFNSKMLNDLSKRNRNLFESMEIKHFAMYLADYGCYNILCEDLEIIAE